MPNCCATAVMLPLHAAMASRIILRSICSSVDISLSAATAVAADNEMSTLEQMERRMIRDAIAACNGNMTAVAQQLGITRQTLYNKIKRYGL